MSHIPAPQPPRLSSMYQIPTERDHWIHNASNVVGVMKVCLRILLHPKFCHQEIGLEWAPTVTDIVDSCPLDMLLLTLYMYNTLPMYVPQADLLFRAKIHQKLVQTIQLTNPTTKPITYTIRLDGSPYFKVLVDTITIDAKSEYLCILQLHGVP